MRVFVAHKNWRTHLYRDCHTIVTLPDPMATIEEGTVPEVCDVPRRWCSFCVARFLMENHLAAELATELGAVPARELEPETGQSAELHSDQPSALSALGI